jgi:hypothetical protein
MVKRLLLVLTSMICMLAMSTTYASLNVGTFDNAGTITLDDTAVFGTLNNTGTILSSTVLTLNIKNKLDSSQGYITAPTLFINAPNITSPTDSMLGKVCWQNSFTLNGKSVSKQYSHCLK